MVVVLVASEDGVFFELLSVDLGMIDEERLLRLDLVTARLLHRVVPRSPARLQLRHLHHLVLILFK